MNYDLALFPPTSHARRGPPVFLLEIDEMRGTNCLTTSFCLYGLPLKGHFRCHSFIHNVVLFIVLLEKILKKLKRKIGKINSKNKDGPLHVNPVVLPFK